MIFVVKNVLQKILLKNLSNIIFGQKTSCQKNVVRNSIVLNFSGTKILVWKNFVLQKIYCQNPNLTTTQPQPNLNLVGFDMIITLHTTPHPPPHRNSDSTRKNGPRGLKFVMQHHPAILTTTQHNFNPTIFWGGDHQPLPYQG